VLVALAPSSAAAQLYVSPGGTTTATGNDWNSTLTLQEALSRAALNPVASPVIWVKNGYYKPTATSDEGVSFLIPAGIAVYGGFAGTESFLSQRSPTLFDQTVLDGNLTGTVGSPLNTDHVVRIRAGGGTGQRVLDGFLISNGYAQNTSGATSDGSGAGLLIGDGLTGVVANVRLRNLTFSECRASESGGAVAGFFLKRLQMANCQFHGNRAGHGTVGAGGAIYLEGSGDGGGDTAIHNVWVTSNRAPRGAAIAFRRMFGGRFSLLNALITGNINDEPSGAVYVDVDSSAGGGFGRLVLTHSTITGNFGGGVEIADSNGTPNPSETISIQSSIIWGNRRVVGGVAAIDPNLFGAAVGASSVSVTYCNVGVGLAAAGLAGVYPGFKNINANPMFVASGMGNYQLSTSSPCLDAADDARLDSGPTSLVGLGDVADLDGDFITAEPVLIDLAGEDREEAAVPPVPLSQLGSDVSFGGRVSDMGCFEKQFITGTTQP
jgi:hypothetical protein